MVLVHGLAGSLRWWQNVVPALAARYSVFMVDLPGFGSMRRFPGGFVLDEAADWLAAWMGALSLPPAHLVGHSMGAFICLHVAARRPEEIGCLVLVDAAGVPSGRTALGHLWPLVQESLLSSPALLLLMVRDALRAGPFTLWHATADLLAQDVRSDAQRVKAPTLLVWGEKDALVPPSLGYILHREIEGSCFQTISGARHVPMLDRPDALNEAIIAFLETRTAPRP